MKTSLVAGDESIFSKGSPVKLKALLRGRRTRGTPLLLQLPQSPLICHDPQSDFLDGEGVYVTVALQCMRQRTRKGV